MRSEFRRDSLAATVVDGVRLGMRERGFAPVDTPPFFDGRLSLGSEESRVVLPSHGRHWWKSPPLVRYGCWLEGLLGRALAEESLALAALEFRREPAGSEDQVADRLHADGSYLRSVYTLYGPTTVYRDGGVELPVPRGQTLLMTALDRARALGVPCTLHRRPGPGPERAVIVGSFEPRPQKPMPGDREPQAARGRRRCHRS